MIEHSEPEWFVGHRGKMRCEQFQANNLWKNQQSMSRERKKNQKTLQGEIAEKKEEKQDTALLIVVTVANIQ